jgi:hypothetical protein
VGHKYYPRFNKEIVEDAMRIGIKVAAGLFAWAVVMDGFHRSAYRHHGRAPGAGIAIFCDC